MNYKYSQSRTNKINIKSLQLAACGFKFVAIFSYMISEDVDNQLSSAIL